MLKNSINLYSNPARLFSIVVGCLWGIYLIGCVFSTHFAFALYGRQCSTNWIWALVGRNIIGTRETGEDIKHTLHGYFEMEILFVVTSGKHLFWTTRSYRIKGNENLRNWYAYQIIKSQFHPNPYYISLSQIMLLPLTHETTFVYWHQGTSPASDSKIPGCYACSHSVFAPWSLSDGSLERDLSASIGNC